jgi:protease II
VAIQTFTKLLFSFSDVLKTTNCTFQEADNIFCVAVGIAVYDEFFSCMCAAEFVCALDVFAHHTSSRITFLTLTIVSRSRRDVSYSSTHTGEEFIIYCNANCNTENIICVLECAICGLQYIGET